MGLCLRVGNLGPCMDNTTLDEAFSSHGTVYSVEVIVDRKTGDSLGFGFVEFLCKDEADVAVRALHGAVVEGRRLSVWAASEREARRPDDWCTPSGNGMRRRLPQRAPVSGGTR